MDGPPSLGGPPQARLEGELEIPEIDDSTYQALAGLSAGKLEILEGALGLRDEYRHVTGLDERTYALVKIAALIALDAPPASYGWQIAAALEIGVSPEDLLGVLRAIAPQVGGPRVVAAAPEVMLALGLSLPENGEPA
jgi:alkylhydroperoxidase/carboxymuconolactone decarboxylase family protein YurZ